MPDYPGALNRLKRFNEFVNSNAQLRKLLVAGEYDFLQMSQTNLFLDFLVTPRIRETDSDNGTGGSIRLRQVFSVALSAYSLLTLFLGRARVLVYSGDKVSNKALRCDFRMSNLYRQLRTRRIRFVECIHTVYREDFFANMKERGRSVFYLESIDFFYGILRSLGILKEPNVQWGEIDLHTPEAQQFASIAKRYLNLLGRSQFRLRVLRRLLPLTGLRIFIAGIDTRNYNELIAACNEVGIKTCIFQYGTLSKYEPGYVAWGPEMGRVPKAQYIFVESNYWVSELRRLGSYYSPDDIRVGGNLKEDRQSKGLPQYAKPGSSQTVLIPFETVAPTQEILPYIRKMLEYADLKVAFKFRPDKDIAEQAAAYGMAPHKNLKLFSDMKELGHFDMVAGTYSTFLYDMVGEMKPVAILHTSLDYGEGLLTNGLAGELVLDEANFREKIRTICETDRAILVQRKEALYDGAVSLGKTLDFILDPRATRQG